MEGVRLGKEELKGRFGVSERLAIRIGALRAKGLEVTAAVLEDAVRDRGVEELLLSAPLLRQAGQLTTDSFRALSPVAAAYGIYNGILALEEEALAEQVWRPAEPSKGGLALPPVNAPALIETQDAARLFTPEDIGQIKLTLLTGVDAKAKVEALRKMAYAPLGAEEKGVLTLKALADPDPVVRREAAKSLEGVGLTSEVADSLSTLSEGTPRQKTVALQRLEGAAARLTPAERSLTLAFLVSELRYESAPEVLEPLLTTLAGFADLLASGGEALGSLGRHLLKLMADHFDRLDLAAGKLLRAVGQRAGPAAAETLWREVEDVRDRRLRMFFEEILCAMPLGEEFRRRFSGTVAADLARQTVEDLAARRLSDAFAALGDDALRALLEEYPKVSEENRPRTLSVIDAMAASAHVSDSAREEAGELMLRALRESGRIVRALVMDSRLCGHEKLPPRIKREMALDFIENLHTVKAARIHDMTVAALKRMGPAIVEPMKQTIRKSPHAVVREAALEALVEVSLGLKDVDEIIRFVRKLEEEGLTPVRVFRGVARLCASPHASPELIRSIFAAYSKRAERDAHRIAALGWLASTPAIEPSVAGETVLKLIELLETDLPSPEVRETKTDDGTMFVIGSQTAVYTDLLPDVIDAIRRILLSDRLPSGLRTRVLQRLCAKFRSLSSYEEIWAPGNVNDLARALADVAVEAKTPSGLRLKIVSALATNLPSLSTIRIVAEVCSRPEDDSSDHAKMVGEIGDRLQEMLSRGAYQELEDRRILAVALGRIALNRQVGLTKKKSEEFKMRAVESLLGETGPEFPSGRGVLEQLAVSPTLPKSAKSRLESYAKKTQI